MSRFQVCCAGVFALLVLSPLAAAEEWEDVLVQGLSKKHSETRRNALKQVDTDSVKGLKALWSVLDGVGEREPARFDWYVRQGAYEALSRVASPDAEAEIAKTLGAKGLERSKEAIVHSIIWKIRSEFEKEHGQNDDKKIAEAKYLLRKTRGVEYFGLVLPIVKKIDPDRKRYEWLKLAASDKSSRVRVAAIQGLLSYPDNASIPLLLDNLKSLEKTRTKDFELWVTTRYALEVLTGQYHRDNVSDWLRWWDVVKDRFDVAKRVAEEKSAEEGKGKTRVIQRQGVEVTVNMRVAGDPDGYPLLVLPWGNFEPEYFRPYFHGIEEFARVYYVQLPLIDDFKGLKREQRSGLPIYPTELLADALTEIMKEDVLSGDRGVKQFAILGHGPDASTLASKMTAQFSDAVSHLILISPRSGGEEYRLALESVSRHGMASKNWEIETGVKMVQIDAKGEPTYKPADDAEAGGLGRALQNLHFSDPTSPVVGAMEFLYDIPSSTKVMNDDSWSLKKIFAAKKPKQAVMIAWGERNPWTPASDLPKVESSFQRPYVAKFPRDSETPFFTDPYGFTMHVQKFLQSTGVKPPAARKKAEKERPAAPGTTAPVKK